jgi:uncharacterized RmlC-like cupin family protein
MKKISGILVILLLISVSGWGQTISIQKILEAFVQDFKTDTIVKERAFTFAVKIRDKGDWHVIVDGQGGVELKKGMPSVPVVYYITDYKTLLNIYQGKMTALTAMGRARMSDPTPMNFGFMEGFKPSADFMGWGAKFTFHFWTRGTPEVVDFGKDTSSRFIHGAQAKILYYAQGLRSSWYGIKKGQHVNAKPEDQKNPFPTIVIMIKGVAKARIGGKLIDLKKDTCLHIPAGVSHEFWNDNEETAEFIIVMFGKGA